MSEERYSIGELAAATATTQRTIRFYATEGLLPPPLTEGRSAVYLDIHRRRLRLIQRLKAAYLPLSAIKEQMAGLTDEQVDALLERGGPHRVENTGAGHQARPALPLISDSKTVTYVAQILAAAEQAVAAGPAENSARKSRRVLLISPVLDPDADSSAVNTSSGPVPKSTDERWRRISLCSGVELHVREPLSEPVRANLERLVAYSRALLAEPEA